MVLGDIPMPNGAAVPKFDDIIRVFADENEVERETGYCTAKEGVENFGIRLISFECAPPIENEFVYFGRIRGMARKMFVR